MVQKGIKAPSNDIHIFYNYVDNVLYSHLKTIIVCTKHQQSF